MTFNHCGKKLRILNVLLKKNEEKSLKVMLGITYLNVFRSSFTIAKVLHEGFTTSTSSM